MISKKGSQTIQLKPKTTSIGCGVNSRPKRRGKKPYRGQGKR